jgi:hypothetical protein
MPKVSITEAARLAGVKSRSRFYKDYIDTGIITVDRSVPNRPEIDTAEILRVFGELKKAQPQYDLTQEVDRLKQRTQHLEEMLHIKDEQLRDAVSERDYARGRMADIEQKLLPAPKNPGISFSKVIRQIFPYNF